MEGARSCDYSTISGYVQIQAFAMLLQSYIWMPCKIKWFIYIYIYIFYICREYYQCEKILKGMSRMWGKANYKNDWFLF